LKSILILTSLFFCHFGWATDDVSYLEIARTRQYSGGFDESDLKVQTQVVKLQKSKNEANIEVEEGF
jgi:hypothetical protein